jgi:methylglutaconyl-CoA hydratase
MLITKIENGIGRITIDRPEKRNALTRELLESLSREMVQLRSREDLRLLVLSANGSVFCAGMDLDEMQARASSSNGKQEWHLDSLVYRQFLEALYTIQVPTIARLQGPVLAGGVGIVLACDLIVASSNAFFSLPEPMRGITAAIVTPLLVYRVGGGIAGQLLLSGERIPAERAFQLGLCHAVASPEMLDSRLSQLELAILAGSQSALSITKRHLQECAGSAVLAQLSKSVDVSAQARETSEAREGLAAFLEKRKPFWQL